LVAVRRRVGARSGVVRPEWTVRARRWVRGKPRRCWSASLWVDVCMVVTALKYRSDW